MAVILDARFTSGLDGFSAGTHVTSVGSADIGDAAGALQIGASQTSTIDFTNITSGLTRFDFSLKLTDSSVSADTATLIYLMANGVAPLSASSVATIGIDRPNSSSGSVLRLTYRSATGFSGITANGADLNIRRGEWNKVSIVANHTAKTCDVFIEDVLFVKGIAWPNSSAAGVGRVAIVGSSAAPNTWFDNIKVQDSWSEGESILIDHDFVGGSGGISSSTPQTSTRQSHAQPWMIAPDTAYGGYTLGANGAAPESAKKCFALQRCGANGVIEAEFKTPASGTAYIGILFRFWDYPSATGSGAGVLRVSGSGNTAVLFLPDRTGAQQTAASTSYTLSANTTYTLRLEMRGRVYAASIKVASIDAGSYATLFTHTADTSAKGGRGMLIEELAGPYVDCTIGAATNYVRRFRFTGKAEASEQTRTIGNKYAVGHGSIKEIYALDAVEPTRNIFWSRGIQYGHRSSADMCGSQQQSIVYDSTNVFSVRQTGANVTEYQHLGFGDCYVTLLQRGPWVSDGITVFDNSENFAPDWDLLPSHWATEFRTITSTGVSTLRDDSPYHDWTNHNTSVALPAGHQSLTAFASGQQYSISEIVLNDVGMSGSIYNLTSKLEGSGDPISRAVSTQGTNLTAGSSYRVARAFLVQPTSSLSDATFVAWRDDLATPATLSMATGTRKTDAVGDTNTDGFNERYGWYEINCSGGVAEFTLPIASGSRFMPVFKLNAWDNTKTVITLGGSTATSGTDYLLDDVGGAAVLQLLGVYTTDLVISIDAGGGPTAYTLAADSAAITLAGTDATLTAAFTIPTTSAAITLAGTDATLTAAFTIPTTSASITLAGQGVTLTHSTAGSTAYTLTADSAAITIAAQDAVLRGSFVMPAASGDMSIVGQDAVLQASRVMAAESAAVTLAGQSVTLTHNTVGSAVWPPPDQVLSGITYGPTGTDYTGTATAGGYPTAADIAAAVRSELALELARIDAAISSRSTVAGILGATVP